MPKRVRVELPPNTPLEVRLRMLPRPPRRIYRYLFPALGHPWHLVILAGATVFGVANWSLLTLLVIFLGAELLLMLFALTPAFRRWVDERESEQLRVRIAEVEESLRVMSKGDQERLYEDLRLFEVDLQEWQMKRQKVQSPTGYK